MKNCQHQSNRPCQMSAQIFVESGGRFRYVLGVAELGNDGIWRHVESVFPEENHADWAEKFWDSAYEALHKPK
jgi:hypothetical protein